MRWQWWFSLNTNNQALWSPGPWSSCSLPRGLPCGEGCLFFNLTSKRSFTSSFYPLILSTSAINFRCSLPISVLLSWITTLAPSFRLSRHEDTSSRYNWIQCGLFFVAIGYSSIPLSAQSQSCHVDCSQPSCVLSSWSQWSVISFNDIFKVTEPYLYNHDSSCAAAIWWPNAYPYCHYSVKSIRISLRFFSDQLRTGRLALKLADRSGHDTGKR